MRAGSTVAGRFEVLSLAGSGGMGVVYRARDLFTGEPVALKVLRFRDDVAEERLSREAQILAELSHPGLVRHVAHGVTPDGVFFLALEWLEGASLASRFDQGAMPVAEAVDVVAQMADALDAAHRRGVVHRDIKPSNVVLVSSTRTPRRAARVKVLDFGIAHMRDSAERLTVTGSVLGTPGYMAPEQARGEAVIDARVDVFALGCLLFEALSGRRAFEGDDIMTVLLKVALEEPPRLREVMPDADPFLDDLLARMLAKDPEQRPANGGEIRDALAQLATRDPTDVTADIPPPPMSIGERRWMSAAVVRPAAPPQPGAWERLASAVERHGGRLDPLANGSAVIVVTLSGARAPDAATDLAVRSARCALAARKEIPAASVALVTGRSDRHGDIGRLLGHGVTLLAGDGVFVDDATRRLLETRFDIDQAGALAGERDEEAETRKLLHRPVPFVGRAREVAVLSDMFDECEAGPVAQAAVVVGPPGIGKSRLRQEIVVMLAERPRPPEVWIARGDAVSAGSPFGMISRALRREATVLDGEPAAAQRAKLETRYSVHLSPETRGRTLAFLGELCNVPFPEDAAAELGPARRDPVLMGDHIHRAFEELIEAEQRAAPLVIVLEDLHWGDRPSVDLIDGVLRNLPNAALLVLAMARPELSATFPDLWPERRVQTLRLGELLPKQAEALVRAVLGDRISARDLARIVERAAGNAFFLEELVRSFAAGDGDAMPETVLAMLGARIEHLNSIARRVLRAGSLFGQTFWAEGARALLGEAVSPSDVAEAIDACVRKELLVRRRSSRLAGQTEVAFRHALVRDAAFAMVPEEAMVPGHLRVAEWLERAGEHDMVVLADHFERGKDAKRAAEAYRIAAAQALEGNDFQAAIERAERAISAGASGETLGILKRIQTESHGWRHEYETAKNLGREAMRLLQTGSAAWCAAAIEVARACSAGFDHEGLLSVANEVASLDPKEPEPHHIITPARLTPYLFGTDHRAEANWLLERATILSIRRPSSDPTAMAWLHHARSWGTFVAGDVATSLAHEEVAAAAFDRIGDARNACDTWIGLGHAYRDVGELERAERTLRDASRTSERLGLSRVSFGAKYTLGTVLSMRGSLAEAIPLLRAAADGFTASTNLRNAAYARADLARALIATGDLEGAEAEARTAISMLESTPSSQAYALTVLAQIQLSYGRPHEAATTMRPAILTLLKVGTLADGEVFIRMMWAEVLFATGDARAKDALASARDHVLERAKRITDAKMQRSFVTSIPENARTLLLARERLRG